MIHRKTPNRILIVDDHAVVLKGLTAIVQETLGNSVVIDTASSGQEALKLCTANNYKLCLFDIELPDIDGMALLRLLRNDYTAMRIIIHTMHEQTWYMKEFLDMKVEGVVFKSAATSELTMALHRVFGGYHYYCESAQAQKAIIDHQPTPTSREKETLSLIACGKTTKEIADELGITRHAVEFHRRNLLEKFEARNVAELISIAYKLGYNHHKCGD